MTTCLKEDVRTPVWELVGTAVDQGIDADQGLIFQDEFGQSMRAEAVQVDVDSDGQLLDRSKLVAGRTRWMREAGFIAAAVIGLVLVPSVQSLGLGVDPAGVSPPPQNLEQLSPRHGDSVVSREVERLIGRD